MDSHSKINSQLLKEAEEADMSIEDFLKQTEIATQHMLLDVDEFINKYITQSVECMKSNMVESNSCGDLRVTQCAEYDDPEEKVFILYDRESTAILSKFNDTQLTIYTSWSNKSKTLSNHISQLENTADKEYVAYTRSTNKRYVCGRESTEKQTFIGDTTDAVAHNI